MDVFRALMRSRRWALSQDHVNALNTVEVEFAGVKAVESAHGDLLQHLNLQTPQSPEWMDKWRRLQTRLLYAIAVHLGYKMEQLDVLEGGYIPSLLGNPRRAAACPVAGDERLALGQPCAPGAGRGATALIQ
jgi:hypothetical protein